MVQKLVRHNKLYFPDQLVPKYFPSAITIRGPNGPYYGLNGSDRGFATESSALNWVDTLAMRDRREPVLLFDVDIKIPLVANGRSQRSTNDLIHWCAWTAVKPPSHHEATAAVESGNAFGLVRAAWRDRLERFKGHTKTTNVRNLGLSRKQMTMCGGARALEYEQAAAADSSTGGRCQVHECSGSLPKRYVRNPLEMRFSSAAPHARPVGDASVSNEVGPPGGSRGHVGAGSTVTVPSVGDDEKGQLAKDRLVFLHETAVFLMGLAQRRR
ncbi:hypothetical protein BDU57DRAFT_210310 [Ampelomyces quisqualis]|uniref:Uncharacterized protein n=1 Tax=Ampelomyces quisqualis TaxID=50730 RepID=A0A6A5QM01_AMPQU|nr:hypothetical protein BDU57DRAFT_210310 [Ampelomyces quisqualis]